MASNFCDKVPKVLRNKMDTHNMTHINPVSKKVSKPMDSMLTINSIYKCLRDTLKKQKNLKKTKKDKKAKKSYKR